MNNKTASKIINNHLEGKITEASKKIISEIVKKAIDDGFKPPFGISDVRPMDSPVGMRNFVMINPDLQQRISRQIDLRDKNNNRILMEIEKNKKISIEDLNYILKDLEKLRRTIYKYKENEEAFSSDDIDKDIEYASELINDLELLGNVA